MQRCVPKLELGNERLEIACSNAGGSGAPRAMLKIMPTKSALIVIERRSARSTFPFHHNHRHRVMFGVAKRDQNLRDLSFFCQFFRAAFEDYERLTAPFAAHINILPAHRLPNPGPECLRD